MSIVKVLRLLNFLKLSLEDYILILEKDLINIHGILCKFSLNNSMDLM